MTIPKTIRIGNIDHDINIYLESRNSTRASITKKAINIRIPKYLNQRQREEETHKLLKWAVEQIRAKPELIEHHKHHQNADEIQTISKTYKLKIDYEPRSKQYVKIKENIIHCKIADHLSSKEQKEMLSKQLRKVLAKEHTPELHYHIQRLNQKHFNQPIRKISFRYTTSRWGACHKEKKEIEISTRLLLAPIPILEYVIIHELAHLIEANHSKRFWNHVQKADPSYKQKIKWLNTHGDKLNI